MANTSVPVSQLSLNVFRVGRIFDRTISVYSKNFLPFSLITLVASAPVVFLTDDSAGNIFSPAAQTLGDTKAILLLGFLSFILFLLSQAILVHGAFQSMRGRPVNLQDSVMAALARLLPIVGLIILASFAVLFFVAIFVGVVTVMATATFGVGRTAQNSGITIIATLIIIASVVMVFVAILMLATRWFVAIPVCMVERGGPWRSLKRSAQLTKGHRWKVFGIVLLMYFGVSIIGQFFILAVTAVGGRPAWIISSLAWNSVSGAFFAIFVVVTYYELRSAKEGVDIDQIASVFD